MVTWLQHGLVGGSNHDDGIIAGLKLHSWETPYD